VSQQQSKSVLVNFKKKMFALILNHLFFSRLLYCFNQIKVHHAFLNFEMACIGVFSSLTGFTFTSDAYQFKGSVNETVYL